MSSELSTSSTSASGLLFLSSSAQELTQPDESLRVRLSSPPPSPSASSSSSLAALLQMPTQHSPLEFSDDAGNDTVALLLTPSPTTNPSLSLSRASTAIKRSSPSKLICPSPLLSPSPPASSNRSLKRPLIAPSPSPFSSPSSSASPAVPRRKSPPTSPTPYVLSPQRPVKRLLRMDSVLFQSTQLQLSPSDDGMMALPTQQPDADDDAELLAAPTQLEYSEKGSPEETRQSLRNILSEKTLRQSLLEEHTQRDDVWNMPTQKPMDDSILELGTQIMPEEELNKETIVAVLTSLSAANRDVPVPEEGEVLLGRGPSCHKLCRFDSRHISNIHCKIFCEKRGSESNIVFVMDFSSNGTYVNGKRIQKGDKVALKHEDALSLLPPNFSDLTISYRVRYIHPPLVKQKSLEAVSDATVEIKRQKTDPLPPLTNDSPRKADEKSSATKNSNSQADKAASAHRLTDMKTKGTRTSQKKDKGQTILSRSPSPPPIRAMCKYGKNCYRKNPEHLQRFAHPEK